MYAGMCLCCQRGPCRPWHCDMDMVVVKVTSVQIQTGDPVAASAALARCHRKQSGTGRTPPHAPASRRSSSRTDAFCFFLTRTSIVFPLHAARGIHTGAARLWTKGRTSASLLAVMPLTRL